MSKQVSLKKCYKPQWKGFRPTVSYHTVPCSDSYFYPIDSTSEPVVSKPAFYDEKIFHAICFVVLNLLNESALFAMLLPNRIPYRIGALLCE